MEILVVVGVIVLLLVILGVWFRVADRGLVALDARVDKAWSDITAQSRRRADLLPNLIEAVAGYAAHERSVFESVTEARTETLHAQEPADASMAENRMQSALRGIFAVAEAYPRLQASQDFLQLQGELVDTEDRIQASRRFYNGAVRELNTRVKQFPNTLFARRRGLGERDFFEVAGGAAIAEPPRVQF